MVIRSGLAMASKHALPNLSGAKLTVGRWARGPAVNLVSTDRPVTLTEKDMGWIAEPWKLKPRQFGKLELEKRFLGLKDVPAEATIAFKGSKYAFGKRYKTLKGPPPPQEMFDYVTQTWKVGYRADAFGNHPTVVSTHRPVFAAFGLNRMGAEALRR